MQLADSLLRDRHWMPPEEFDARIILDIGCSIGVTTLEFARRWPDAVVIGIDADRRNVSQARIRTDAFNERVGIYRAILGRDGERACLTGHKPNRRSLQGDGHMPEHVTTMLLDTLLEILLLDWCTFDFVKMDIEGAETIVLEGEWLDRTDRIIVDYHDNLDLVREILFSRGLPHITEFPASEGSWGSVYAKR